MRIFHGTVLLVDERDTVGEWLVEDEGRILFAGAELPMPYHHAVAEHIELEPGQTICPAFTDAYQQLGTVSNSAALSRSKKINALQETLDREIASGLGLLTAAVDTPAGDLDLASANKLFKNRQNGVQLRLSTGAAPETASSAGAARVTREVTPGAASDLTDYCTRAHKAGLQIQLVAKSAEAFELAAAALRDAVRTDPRKKHRHAVVTDGSVTEDGVKYCKMSRVSLIYLAGDLRKDGGNIKDLWDNEVTLSVGNGDSYVAPLTGIKTLVRNGLTVQEAIRMYTINGALTTSDEMNYGSLERGKHANIVILSANPYEVPAEELDGIQIVKTCFDGAEYQPKKPSGGLFKRRR